jgi:hypothetical protein
MDPPRPSVPENGLPNDDREDDILLISDGGTKRGLQERQYVRNAKEAVGRIFDRT